MKNLLFLTAFAALFTFKASAQNPKTNTDTAKPHVTEVILTPPPPQTIPIQDIAKHIGEYVTVCDKVYTARTFEGSNMTLLNLGGNHPNELLTVMIKGENRSKFKEQPEVYYNGKDVCVSGKVIEYKGKPEIEVTEIDQLTLRGH